MNARPKPTIVTQMPYALMSQDLSDVPAMQDIPEMELHAMVCSTCDTVYPMIPNLISDIDECTSDTDNCHTDATCVNDPGTFSCSCNSGYSGDGVTCIGM